MWQEKTNDKDEDKEENDPSERSRRSALQRRFAILCGRQIAAPTARVLVKGEIVSEGEELKVLRKKSKGKGEKENDPSERSRRSAIQ